MNTEDTIVSLLSDIEKKKAEYNDVNKFIRDRGLHKHEITRFVEDSLPMNFLMGKSYLIRNKGIIEIDNGFAYQVGDIRFSNSGEEMWEGIVSFHNVTSKELNGMDVTSDMISHNSEHVVGFILALAKSGFTMYVKG